MIPDLKSYDWIVCNSSAGKDSQAMLDYVAELCREAGILHRLVVLHCDLGKSPKGHEIEWPGTKELAEEHAAFYGARFVICKREVRGFLEEILDRGAWPSQTERYCTSYFKRDQGTKVLTALADESREVHGIRRPWLLNCFGFRAQESTRRRKLVEFANNKRVTNGRKLVDDWLPIHKWLVDDVWARIEKAGTRPHYAYGLGMTRLSCRFCIFAPPSQLAISAKANPALFEEYLDVEKVTGHTFRHRFSLQMVQDAVANDTQFEQDDGCWNM